MSSGRYRSLCLSSPSLSPLLFNSSRVLRFFRLLCSSSHHLSHPTAPSILDNKLLLHRWSWNHLKLGMCCAVLDAMQTVHGQINSI